MTVSRSLALVAGSLLLLAGCMKDPLAGLSPDPNIRIELFGGLGAPAPAPLAFPADAPKMAASLFGRDLSAPVTLVATRGSTTEWRAVDGVTLRLDGGILTGTTGLGYDLYSADAAPLKAAMAAGGGSYTRAFRHMDGERKIVVTEAACSLSRATDATGFTELCRDGVKSFINRFQTEAATAKVTASRQWISDEAGYLGLNPILDP